MTDIIKEMIERKSVRAFEDREISREDKKLILEAAVNAPTAGNQQLYTIIDVTDQTLKERLSESCDHQPFIAKAPLVLIFCADSQKWYDLYLDSNTMPRRPGPGDLMLAVDDAVIAAQNAVSAAWSLGIGSCYIGDIMEQAELHREMLELPEYVFPAAMVVFGYPTEQQKKRPKPERAPIDVIVCENKYRRLNCDQLRLMVSRSVKDKDHNEWVKAFCERKYNSDFSVEMSRSVLEYLKEYIKK